MNIAAAGDSPSRCRPASPAAVVAQADLPAPLGELVLTVTGKCRLWKQERIEVAQELCAHFRDALESGASPDDLAAAFGDPVQTARLITPARKRLRPWWWRAGRQSLRASAGLILLCVGLYAFAAASFYFGSPTISRNFTAQLNAPILALPADERAWPRYLEALRAFGAEPTVLSHDPVPEKPGDPAWPTYAKWLQSKAHAFAILREAAARPHLGFVYRHDLEPALVEIMEARRPGYQHQPGPEVDNPLVIGLLLPHLGEMRRMARWTRADARLAAREGDRERFLRDVDAMLGMGEQCLDSPHVISSLVGIAIFRLSIDSVQEQIAPDSFLTDADLVHLAHRFAGFAGGRVRIDVRGERYSIEDILQRFYTDDGQGDGRFIASDQTDQMYTEFGIPRPRLMFLRKAYQPVKSLTLPSRARLNDMLDEFEARAAADDALPPWRHDERGADTLYRQISNSGIDDAMPIIKVLQGGDDAEPFAHAFAARDLALTYRDTLLVVLALELHHRRTGEYPARLDDLVPTLLASVPRDPITGEPLRYIPPAGEGMLPRLYSVGVDGHDDAGTPPATRGGRFTASSLTLLKDFRVPRDFTPEEQLRMADAKGDWLLWPRADEAPQ